MREDRRIQRERDAEQLRRLGYAQQLLRDMGGFSNFALSFSVISVLTGAVTLYGYGLQLGGPLVMGLGWPLVSLMSLFVAAGMAQLASAYPTAGALYHWSSLFGGPGWGFFTAWVIALWAEAYSAMVALSTLALYASYALPIALALRARRRGLWNARGPWNLGRWSDLINAVALGWTGVIGVLFVLPPNQLAGYTFAGALAVLLAYWFGWMRGRFAGPRLAWPAE